MNILTMKQATKTITLISVAGAKLDERIHSVGLAGLAHFLQHGDTTIISSLCNAMPRSGRGNALKFWITKHARVKWSAKAHGGAGGYIKNGETALNSWEKIAIIMQADAMPFYMKEDKEASQWNEGKAILALVAKLKKHSETHALSDDGVKLLAAMA